MSVLELYNECSIFVYICIIGILFLYKDCIISVLELYNKYGIII